MNKLVTYFIFLLLVSCQNKPTKIMEESVDVFADKSVVVDTRSAFEYATYHIAGSVNLNTSEYLILKNPKTKQRILDPDIAQIIERLARRGITPEKRVYLLSEATNSLESKKWRWLLKNLEVENVILITLTEFKKKFAKRTFAEPASEKAWVLKISEDLQKEFITKKAKDCFVNWSEKLCH